MEKRIIAFAAVMGVLYIFLMWKLNCVINDEEIISAASGRGSFSVEIQRYKGYIYDRNMTPLVNRGSTYMALINPDTFDLEEIYPKIADMEKFTANSGGSAPFLCELSDGDVSDPLTPVTEVKVRYDDRFFARHILGYSSENYGKCGIEGLFSDFSEEHEVCSRFTYSVNAMGNVLDGADIKYDNDLDCSAGVVLSLDYDIQSICEKAAEKLDRGAIIVMDVKNGDIVAAVSRPVYDIENMADYIDREDAPFVDRVFSAYSVGSVFKTVIASAALEYGISDEFSVKCGGKIMVGEQEFGCHYWAGHGLLDMRSAMVESCNPYFISLGRNISTEFLENYMTLCGFGQEYDLGGIVSGSGYLPSAEELAVPAEKANLCFGQGKLSATPLQVCRFVCGIANGGLMPGPRLIYGTVNSVADDIAAEVNCTRIMSEETADTLKSFMYDTLYKENSAAIPDNTDGGGKTSTAQTGRFSEDGTEELTCWFAGFFSYDEPEYAAVIVAENGVSGNLSCGPIFREIADGVWQLTVNSE